MMKDLKHYFSSPANSDNEVLNDEIICKKRRIGSISYSLECTSDVPVIIKKKRKKKHNESELEKELVNGVSSKSEKKRKKKGVRKETAKKPRVSTLVENVNTPPKTEEEENMTCQNKLKVSVDSCKENSFNSSVESDEKLETNNSLHNYFNKVDKLSDISIKPNVLKVKAVVHYPPSEEGINSPPKRLRTRLRRRKSVDLRLEYDIITSEEDNSLTLNSTNELSVNVSVTVADNTDLNEMLISPDSPNEENNLKDSPILIDDDSVTNSRLENSNTTDALKQKYDGTLNSFFKIPCRLSGLSIPEIIEERKIARQQFLNSGIPQSMKKQMDKPKETIQFIESAPFPKLHHITQADILNVIWNLKMVKLKLKSSMNNVINLPPWSNISNIQKLALKSTNSLNGTSYSITNNKIIKKLKKEITKHPIGKWYKELNKLKENSSYEMWSEKFRPKSSAQLIGNLKNVEELKSWLQTLNGTKNNVEKGQTTYCSEDEFVKSEDESEQKIKNTALLHGPSGCGKTASVYALAEEIGYQILEINSSCDRMGKKILHKFSEALQSHKVETNVLNFDGAKKNKTDDFKKSLFLIKDVDVIFPDCDDGFISTIATLAATSKRPIILTLNEFQPKNLAKILPLMHFKLDFELLPQDLLISWVRTLAATEGIHLDRTEAYRLTNWVKGDIRKLLLQLQFSFVNSSKVIYADHTTETNQIWEKMSTTNLNDKKEAKNTAKLYNLLTVCDTLLGTLNLSQVGDDVSVFSPWQSTIKDSSELNQPEEISNHLTRDMLADTVKYLEHIVLSTAMEKHFLRSQKQSVISRVEQEVVSPMSILSHSGVATDYLSTLRSMARLEKRRLETHSKRNNRYFSYLQSIGLTKNTIQISNVLSEAFNSTF